jgi:hypothetical protein
MARINIKDLADQVNRNTDNFKYFWSYGLLKETRELWADPVNLSMLNETSQNILDTILNP